jgi:hypothetical protein
MGLFHHEHEPGVGDPTKGGPDGVFEIVGADGDWVRYTPDDFEEIFSTISEPEMRQHLGLGWLLLDEQIVHDPGSSAPWIDTMLRREAGRVLPAGDDPAYVPLKDCPVYVLGYLKDGATGTHAHDPRSAQ